MVEKRLCPANWKRKICYRSGGGNCTRKPSWSWPTEGLQQRTVV